MFLKSTMLFLTLLIFILEINAQVTDSSLSMVSEIQAGLFMNNIEKKIEGYQNEVSRKTIKTLRKLTKLEAKIKPLIKSANPALYEQLFSKNSYSFEQLLAEYENGQTVLKTKVGKYNYYKDQLNLRYNFLKARISDSVRCNSELTRIRDLVMDSLNSKMDQDEIYAGLI